MGATQEPRQNSSAVFELIEGLNPLQGSSVILSFFGVPCSERVYISQKQTDKLVPAVFFSTGFEFVASEIPSTEMNNYPLPQQPQRTVLCFPA